MHVYKWVLGLALAFALAVPFAVPAHALSLEEGAQPAEVPPADYTGDTYVDSRGCIYIRAGFAGAVTWVPRVTRDRQVVCGATPTRIAGEAAGTTAAALDSDPPAVQTAPAPDAPATPAAAATPAARAPSRSASVPTPPADVAHPAVAAPEQLATYQVRDTIQITCPSRNGVRHMRISDGRRIPVRCGPRTVEAVTYYLRNDDGTLTRVVAIPSASRVSVPALPAGYSPAWDDDRLNPDRGPRTAAGDAQMARVWTNTVPRQPVAATDNRATATAAEPAPTATGHRWVQVGTFGVESNATRTAQRLKALGLPIAYARPARGDQSLKIVLAGPFASASALTDALAKVRGLGFSDAFIR